MANTTNCKKYLFQVRRKILRYSTDYEIPQSFRSDRASIFMREEILKFYNRNLIIKSITSPRHDHRGNRKVEQLLRMKDIEAIPETVRDKNKRKVFNELLQAVGNLGTKGVFHILSAIWRENEHNKIDNY